MEELAVPQRLRDALREVQPGHLLVPDLGVEADAVGLVELVDERERVADGGQQDVAARLVRLGLEGEPDVVALVAHVGAEQVQALLVAVERGGDVLAAAGLRALAAAPQHVGLGAQLGGEVDVAQHLGDGVPADGAVVGGQAAVLEHRGAEQVRRRHLDAHAGLGQRLLEPLEGRLAGGVVRAQVVVVERDGRGAELGEPVHRLDRVERGADGAAEDVDALPAHGPEAEAELVVLGGGVASVIGNAILHRRVGAVESGTLPARRVGGHEGRVVEDRLEGDVRAAAHGGGEAQGGQRRRARRPGRGRRPACASSACSGSIRNRPRTAK